MKLTNEKIAMMVSSVLRGSKAHRAHSLIHPEREWFVGVLCFVIMVAGACWWAVSLYVRFIDPTERASEEVVPESIVFRPAQVEVALDTLEARRGRYQAAEMVLRSDARATEGVVDAGGVEEAVATTSLEATVAPILPETEAAASATATDSSMSSEVVPSDETANEQPMMAF